MKKQFILFCLCLASVISSVAQQKEYNLEIFAMVKDNVTLEALQDSHVTLMLADSTVVDTVTTHQSESNMNGRRFVISCFNLTKVSHPQIKQKK